MALDLILRNARLASAGPEQPTVDIGVRNGLIVAVEPHLAAEGPAYDAGGKLVSPGLIESHFHLDKARLMDRVLFQSNRMVRDHMERTAAIKQTFTPDEMYARAQATLEQCLLHGVTHMRTQVEVDPNMGLLGFEVIEQLRQEYAWAIGPRSWRRPLSATQHHPTASLAGISWYAMSHEGLCQVF